MAMMTHTGIRTATLVIGVAAVAMGGCASFKLREAPSGFAEVHRDGSGLAELRAKAGDKVGLRVVSFGNVRGGSLAYWSQDLVDKLGARGYTLVRHAPARSANGVVGTRFDFDYSPPGAEDQTFFYSVVLFATDEYRVVIQMAGDHGRAVVHGPELDAVAAAIRVRGCRARSRICRGAQPSDLAPPPASDSAATGPVSP